MMNWRTACLLLGLSSVLACATATNDAAPGGDSGGADNGGGPVGESGAPVAGAANPGAGALDGGAGAPVVAGAANGGAPSHAGGGGAPSGGHSGTSSGGASGAAGKGGATSTAGAGGSGGATNDGPCANPVDIMGKKSGDVGLAGGCFRTTETFNSLGCSNFSGGRTIKVNGTLDPCAGTKTTFAPMIGGYNYFEVSAGDVPYAAFFWYTS
ncbi:MAG: hypothetical protein ABUL62_30200 [Myxococcales bacterium]